MSSFHKRKMAGLTDQRSIAAALDEMGLKPESHETEQALENSWGSGHGVSKAHVIVRKAQLQKYGAHVSDLGFRKGEDGKFEMILNDMDHRHFGEGARFHGELVERYGIAQLRRAAKRNGHRVSTDVKEIQSTKGVARRVTYSY